MVSGSPTGFAGSSRRERLGQKVSHLADLKAGDVRLYIPSITNRTTGKSMGEHTEITAKEWGIPRDAQDRVALESHERAVAAWDAGFFDDLVIPIGELRRDTLPRKDTSLAEARAAAALVRQDERPRDIHRRQFLAAHRRRRRALGRIVRGPCDVCRRQFPRRRLVDWEVAAVDFRTEGLLMAPAFAIPRLLARNGLAYRDIDIWEIHEAFAAQVLFHIKALEDKDFVRSKAGVDADLGDFPRERVNPNGGSVALGHPFGATGARILSQAVKELATPPRRSALHREHLHRRRAGRRRAAAIGALASTWPSVVR